MYEIFQPQLDFKPRKDPLKQWIILLREDRDTDDPRIVLRDMAGFGGKNVGTEIEGYVMHRYARPLLLPVGDLGGITNFGGRVLGAKTLDCALIAGSEQTRCANSIATRVVQWHLVLSDPDSSASACFAVTGDAVLLKRRPNEKLTTFSRREALEVMMSLTDELDSDVWFPHAVDIAYRNHSSKKKKGHTKK